MLDWEYHGEVSEVEGWWMMIREEYVSNRYLEGRTIIDNYKEWNITCIWGNPLGVILYPRKHLEMSIVNLGCPN